MAIIQMSCPTTGELVNTGQHVSPAAFAETAILGGRFRCSSCNRVHDWTKADVRLVSWPGAPSTP